MTPSPDAAPIAAGALAPGTELGRYQIIKRLALGGMAELYLARQIADAGVQKIVAVKRVLPHLAEDGEFVRMFLNEARLAANLDHSNIAHVVDFGSVDGEHFMAMEYVHGRSVHAILRAGSRMDGVPLECALLIVREIAAALHYAHERCGPDGEPLGLVHRDVSPSNVLVSYDGEVKLVDFGIAKATARSHVTQTNAIKGKLAYMSPEQLRGDSIDRRADVFSLGVVTYELTTGQRCFYAAGEFALINRVAAARFDKPTAVLPSFPPALEAIIVRALAAAPDERFETARELQVAIEELAASSDIRLSKVALSEHMRRVFGYDAYPTTHMLPLPASASPTPSGPPSFDLSAIRRPLRRRTLWWTAAALAAGVGVGVGAPRLLGSDEGASEAKQPSTSLSDAAGKVAPMPEDVAPPEHEPDPSEQEPQEMIVISEDDAADPKPRVRSARRRSKTNRSRKSKRKRGANQSEPNALKPREYLPPSRREQ